MDDQQPAAPEQPANQPPPAPDYPPADRSNSPADRAKKFGENVFSFSQKPATRNIFTSTLDEKDTLTIHRHPFGIIVLYAQALFGVLGATLLLYFVAPSALNTSHSKTYAIITGLVVFVVFILAIVLLVATYVYRESRLIVSNSNVSQVIQRGLFSNRISRLSMANVQDVSADQKGFFASIMNYGTLTIETAGEQENFTFQYCPNPNHYAGEILAAREQYIDQDVERAYRITHHTDLRD